MNKIRSIILLLVYSLTFFAVLFSARQPTSIFNSSENTEKEVVVNSTFEHRESSSVRLPGKLYSSEKGEAYGNRYSLATIAETVSDLNVGFNDHGRVPIRILQCIYRL
jgi:hypothetical protein